MARRSGMVTESGGTPGRLLRRRAERADTQHTADGGMPEEVEDVFADADETSAGSEDRGLATASLPRSRTAMPPELTPHADGRGFMYNVGQPGRGRLFRS